MGNDKSSHSAKSPMAFTSYSWTTEEHKELVRSWADRLLADGVKVILDVYDLKEGQDKYSFMEKMVTDSEVTHVLVICDKVYAEKADKRKAGVGTESQIISKEVYEKVDQSKFIPIICEFFEGQPALPIFFKSRIFIDFSTSEKVNENWEQLIRLLHGKPRFQKPALGAAPAYIREEGAAPASPVRAKFETLRQAIVQQKSSVRAHRRDFLDACINYTDAFRTRQQPDAALFGRKIIEVCGKLVVVRDALVDWVLVESDARSLEEFNENLIELLERLLEQKARPNDVDSWRDDWFDAHKLFVYETFLYIVATLLKTGSYDALRAIFTAQYLRPQSENHGNGNDFYTFGNFYGYSPGINDALGGLTDGRTYLSTAAELVRRQASRSDLPFAEVMQAELLIQLIALTKEEEWFPNTLYYASHSAAFPFFIRATRKKDFGKLATITGIADPDQLRAAANKGKEKYVKYRFNGPNFWHFLNMEKWGTLT